MKIIRTLGIALNTKNQVAEILEVRQLHSTGSKAIASYWTGRTFKTNKAAHTEQLVLGRTITQESNGHPAAWSYDVTTLQQLPSMADLVANACK
jgi:hypothetical protein